MRFDAVTDYLLRHLTPKLWCALMLLLIVVLGFKWQQGLQIETNILALLPATEQDSVVEKASQQFNEALARRHLILVGAEQLPLAIAAADALALSLKTVEGLSRVEYRFDSDRQRQSIAPYLDFKFQLLDQNSRNVLREQGGAALTQSTLQMLYSPMAPVSSSLLASDPLLLFYRFVTGLSQGLENITLQDGVLVTQKNNKHYVLINLTLADSPFSMQLQQQLLPVLDSSVMKIRQSYPEVEVLNVGMIRYAQQGVDSARQEISTIGLGSLLGVVVILFWVFRSPLPFMASLLPIAVGFIAAFTACQWLFGSVHLLTLVFGASLIGISIDYSFHFFTDRLGEGESWSGREGIRRIFPGISLGLLTTLLGYIGLCFAPFPGMQQMAVFSMTGLFAAFLTVVCLFPYLAATPQTLIQGRTSSSVWLQLGYLWSASLAWSNRRVVIFLLLLVVVGLAGLQQLTVNDDIRMLQSASPTLRAEEQRAMAIIGRGLSNQFLLVEGESVEQLLQREEQLQQRLFMLQQTGKLDTFDAISTRLPSRAQQRDNIHLVKEQLLADPNVLKNYASTLGLAPDVVEDFSAAYQTLPAGFLTLEQWLASEAGAPWHHLWIGQTERGYASVVVLYRGDLDALRALEQSSGHVSLVDKVNDISDLLGRYRQQAAKLLIFSYLLIYGLLCYRYGYWRAIKVMLPPAMAVLMALGGLGWMGQALNIFHLLALLLVLGIGVDYTLFLEEGAQHRDRTMLAILLSAVTTLLSFGLLALSVTPAVQAFGITVLMGITVCLLLSPMLCGRELQQ